MPLFSIYIQLNLSNTDTFGIESQIKEGKKGRDQLYVSVLQRESVVAYNSVFLNKIQKDFSVTNLCNTPI